METYIDLAGTNLHHGHQAVCQRQAAAGALFSGGITKLLHLLVLLTAAGSTGGHCIFVLDQMPAFSTITGHS